MTMAARRTSGFAYVYDRSVGLPSRFADEVRAEGSLRMQAVVRNFIYRRAMKVWSLALDPVDARFLLVGTSRSHLLLYDLHQLDEADSAMLTTLPGSHNSQSGTDSSVGAASSGYDTNNPLPPVCAVHARERDDTSALPSQTGIQTPTLQYGASAVDWYPVDGGIFISSGFSGHVKIWDSDRFESVGRFDLRSRVYCAKFSPAATTHSLIAAATANGEVRLCDMAVDAAVHSLLGHRDEIWTLAWSPGNEFHLATGTRDGEIRMWDIRRSGSTACLMCLNHEGPAVVPGRSSLHTNTKRLPSTSLASAARPTARKRQRLRDNTHRSINNDTGGRASMGRQRNDPHVAASTSFASAHQGGVNSLAFTPDGRYMLSSGIDNKLRLWHSGTGTHQFMNYEHVENDMAARSLQMAVVQEADAWHSTVVYHPNGRYGQMNAYRVFGDHGVPIARSTAHYEQITACAYRHSKQELYTAGEDGLIMRWNPGAVELCPDRDDGVDEDKTNGDLKRDGADDDADTWSEDDEEVGVEDHRFIPPILRQES